MPSPPIGESESASPPRFVVDQMLGRLTRWLRLLGYDALYASGMDDAEIARLARAQGRVILTRDMELTRRQGVVSLLIESQNLSQQVAQVVRRFAPPPEATLSRCPICNCPLEDVDRELVRTHVPPYVFATQERFRHCPACGRHFWRGTHWQRISRRLASMSAPGNQ